MKNLALVSLLGLSLALFVGCSLFRANPLKQNRGAIVLILDTRIFTNLKSLRQMLSSHDACATIFVRGQIGRGMVPLLFDLQELGCEVGLSGLRGVDPQLYSQMYGQQKWYQDEIVTQVLDAQHNGLNPRYYLLDTLSHARPSTLTLPSFLASKGFRRVVHKMPREMSPRAKPASALTEPMIHTYTVLTNNFDRAQIASLAKHNEILVVSPSPLALPLLLEEANSQGVPFATLADLKAAEAKCSRSLNTAARR